ncbi:hypothetical protein J5N97_029954 [Dioscorea zingiberensis]|uniref:Dof zinc finger protein n=1 Tax=Dioscorea zingiberensis TaxID=325984 RepID=A0A9D5BX28_9LILI|nr:hypothetical protein J5N97_029954 [Dioscorea zingiberensis]
MDTAQWPQGIGLMKPMEELVGAASNNNNNNSNNNNNITGSTNNNNNTRATSQVVERRTRPQKEQALNCPRCNSTNTKFCYYNNYSLTQPRYFCKTCRRYWTEGGSLRNVPVGGGSRKTKRSSCTSNTTTIATTATTSTASMSAAASTTTSSIRGQDLNLAFPNPRNMADFRELPNMDSSSNSANQSTSLSAMDLLRSGMSVRGLSPFIPMPMSMPDAGSVIYPSGFGLHDFKPPSLSFPLDGGMQAAVQENAGRLLFPFEDLRQVTSNNAVHDFEQNRGAQGASDPQVVLAWNDGWWWWWWYWWRRWILVKTDE